MMLGLLFATFTIYTSRTVPGEDATLFFGKQKIKRAKGES